MPSQLIPLNHDNTWDVQTNDSAAPTLGERLNSHILDGEDALRYRVKQLLNAPSSDANLLELKCCISQLRKLFFAENSHFSANTWISLSSRWAVFETWCDSQAIDSLPCSAASVARFIDSKRQCAMNTLLSYCWAISRVHLYCALPSPIETEKLRKTIKSISNKKEAQRELTSQASPFRLCHRELIASQWINSDRIIERRDLAILFVAYESMLRENELCNIRLSDLELQLDGTAILVIPFTKTNKSGDPDNVHLTAYCVSVLKDYLSLGGLSFSSTGPLFRPSNKHNSLQKGKIVSRIPPSNHKQADYYPINGKFLYLPTLNTRTIYDAFKRAHKCLILSTDALIPNKQWSGHSARVGSSMDLLASGKSTLSVQQAGRWSSPRMVYRYGRSIQANESAMASFLKDVTRKAS